MNEELIKRLRLKAEVLAGLRDATASLLTQAADALSRPAPAVQVPEGWKLVPVEPTPEMLSAAVPFPEHLRLRHPDDVTWEARMQAATAADQMVAAQTYRKMLAATPTPAPVATEAVALPKGRNSFGLDMAYFGSKMGILLTHMSHYKPDEFARECARMAATADAAVLRESEFQAEAEARGGGVDALRAEIIASLHGIAEFVGSPIAGGRGKWKRHALTAAALLASAPAVPVGDGFVSAGVVINNNQPGSQYIVEAPHGVTIPVGTEVFTR